MEVSCGPHRLRYSYILLAVILLAAHPPIATADEPAPAPMDRVLAPSEDGDLACELVDLDESAVKSLGIAQDHALLVVLPAKDGPAEMAGLKSGDIIVDVNAQPASKLDEFSATIKRAGSGAELKLGVWRLGVKTILSVGLGSTNSRIKTGRIEQEIEAYEAIGKIFGKRDFPAIWGFIQYKLGELYWIRVEGGSEDNFETAIASYNSALTVLTKGSFPQQWAQIEEYLALAYMDRMKGDRAENLEAAIRAHNAALAVMSWEKSPREWAQIQNALGLAYMDRAEGNHEDNVDAAIEAYKATLAVLTKEAFPQDWARTQKNLGVAYEGRRRGEKVDNLEAAVKAYEAALTVYQRASLTASVAAPREAPVKCEAKQTAQESKIAVAAESEPQAPDEKTKSAAKPENLNNAPEQAKQEPKAIAAPVAANGAQPLGEQAKPVGQLAEEPKKEAGGAQQAQGETNPVSLPAEANATEQKEPAAKGPSQTEPRPNGRQSTVQKEGASKRNDRKTRKGNQVEAEADQRSAGMRHNKARMKSKCGGDVVWIDRRSNVYSAGTVGYGQGRGRFACQSSRASR